MSSRRFEKKHEAAVSVVKKWFNTTKSRLNKFEDKSKEPARLDYVKFPVFALPRRRFAIHDPMYVATVEACNSRQASTSFLSLDEA